MEVKFNGGLGAILAVIVIVLCVVFAMIGKMDALHAILIGLTAASRLC